VPSAVGTTKEEEEEEEEATGEGRKERSMVGRDRISGIVAAIGIMLRLRLDGIVIFGSALSSSLSRLRFTLLY
jgi:hypothetical protein